MDERTRSLAPNARWALAPAIFAATLLICLALLRGDAGTTAAAPSLADPLPNADLNCDGHVDSVDALAVLRYVAALPPLHAGPSCPPIGAEAAPAFGDVNCDGVIDSVDALIILRNVAGLPVNLAPGCAQAATPTPNPVRTPTPTPSPIGTPTPTATGGKGYGAIPGNVAATYVNPGVAPGSPIVLPPTGGEPPADGSASLAYWLIALTLVALGSAALRMAVRKNERRG